jgi:hypothetical protein
LLRIYSPAGDFAGISYQKQGIWREKNEKNTPVKGAMA